jgi:DNA-binding transcriptional MocR family regulator
MDLTRILQLQRAPGVLDLAWGHPDLDLLPVADVRQAMNTALDQALGVMLTYGIDRGIGPLRDAVAAHLGVIDGGAPADGELMISAGNSHALSHVAMLYAQPGSVIFVENPTYHLALRILRDLPITLHPIQSDADGLDVAELAEAVRAYQAKNQPIAFLYTIATFQNPTGTTLSAARRAALRALCGETGLLVVEDDVYRELWYDAPPLPSLWSTFPRGSVIRLGSFSKSLAPGLRIGYITAAAAQIDRLSGCGLLDSGGGMAHFPGFILAELFRTGTYQRIVETYRARYASRRDALVTALAPLRDHGYTWAQPSGGYFLWVRLPAAVTAQQALTAIRARRVDALPATLFSSKPLGYEAIRLAFSLYDEAALTQAGATIVAALR